MEKKYQTASLPGIDPGTKPEPAPLVCSGVVRFHFWGEYSETIVLKAPDEISAGKLADYLSEGMPEGCLRRGACGETYVCGPFETAVDADGNPMPQAIIATLAGKALKHAKARLKKLDPDPREICSMARSIDRGPTFRFRMP